MSWQRCPESNYYFRRDGRFDMSFLDPIDLTLTKTALRKRGLFKRAVDIDQKKYVRLDDELIDKVMEADEDRDLLRQWYRHMVGSMKRGSDWKEAVLADLDVNMEERDRLLDVLLPYISEFHFRLMYEQFGSRFFSVNPSEDEVARALWKLGVPPCGIV